MKITVMGLGYIGLPTAITLACLLYTSCTHGAYARMNPPLRTEADREALILSLIHIWSRWARQPGRWRRPLPTVWAVSYTHLDTGFHAG